MDYLDHLPEPLERRPQTHQVSGTRWQSRAQRYGQSILLSAALALGGGAVAIGTQVAPAAACHTVTNGSPLNLRSSPNDDSTIIASIAKGRNVTVLRGGSNGWVRVRADIPQGSSMRSVEGWMVSSFLRPCVVAQPPSTCRLVATNTVPLNIRSRAEDDAPILGTIAKGRTLTLLGGGFNGWCGCVPQS